MNPPIPVSSSQSTFSRWTHVASICLTTIWAASSVQTWPSCTLVLGTPFASLIWSQNASIGYIYILSGLNPQLAHVNSSHSIFLQFFFSSPQFYPILFRLLVPHLECQLPSSYFLLLGSANCITDALLCSIVTLWAAISLTRCIIVIWRWCSISYSLIKFFMRSSSLCIQSLAERDLLSHSSSSVYSISCSVSFFSHPLYIPLVPTWILSRSSPLFEAININTIDFDSNVDNLSSAHNLVGLSHIWLAQMLA